MQQKKHFSYHEFLITCFYKIYFVDTGSNEVGGFRGYFAKLRRKMSPNNHLTVCWARFNVKAKDYHSIKDLNHKGPKPIVWHPSLFESLGKWYIQYYYCSLESPRQVAQEKMNGMEFKPKNPILFLLIKINLFKTCFMAANDYLKGKTNHFTGFYTHTISRPKIPKPVHTHAIETVILNA